MRSRVTPAVLAVVVVAGLHAPAHAQEAITIAPPFANVLTQRSTFPQNSLLPCEEMSVIQRCVNVVSGSEAGSMDLEILLTSPLDGEGLGWNWKHAAVDLRATWTLPREVGAILYTVRVHVDSAHTRHDNGLVPSELGFDFSYGAVYLMAGSNPSSVSACGPNWCADADARRTLVELCPQCGPPGDSMEHETVVLRVLEESETGIAPGDRTFFVAMVGEARLGTSYSAALVPDRGSIATRAQAQVIDITAELLE